MDTQKFLAFTFKYRTLLKTLIVLCLLKLSTFFPRSYLLAEYLTKNKLQLISKAVEMSKTDNRELPQNISQLAILNPLSMSQYDFWGERINYTPLSRNEFVLQAFGSDQKRNLWVANTKTFNRSNKYTSFNNSIFYPAQFLEGLSSPEGQYFSRLYQNDQNTKLVIFNRDNNNLYISTRENTKEFLWLNNHSIAYTANNSQKYDAGLFIWDLESGEDYNLTNKLESRLELKKSHKLCLSLSRSLTTKLIVTASACEKIKNFASFYNESNQFRIEAVNNRFELLNADAKPVFDYMFTPLFLEPSEGNEIQKDISGLSLQGKIEIVLERWQGFAEKYADSPLFPYSVFIISQLYQSAQMVVEDLNDEEAQSLLALSKELSWGISRTPTAPDYIKVFSEISNDREKYFLGEGKTIGDLSL